MKTKYVIAFLVFSIYSILANSQSWENAYGGPNTEEGGIVRQTTDSGFIVGGSTNSFGAGAFDFYLIKTDQAGDTNWVKTYGGIYNDKCNSVLQTFDGGYIAMGESNSFSSNQNIYLVKTDAAGVLTWSKSIGDSNSQSPNSIVQTTDSGFCIVGTVGEISTGTSKVIIVRTDINGDTIWKNSFNRGSLNIGYSVQQTPDNGFIISASTYNLTRNAYDVYLIKTDDQGDSLWTKTVSGTGSTYGNSIVLDDSGYVVAGISGENFLAISFDLNGNVRWQYEYEEGGMDRCFSIANAPDGFLLAGYTLFGGESDMLILKIDSLGNKLWSKKYGSSQHDEGFSIQSLPTGGFIAAGTTNYNIYLVRSDCDNFPTVQISIVDTICIGDTMASTLHSSIMSGVTYQWYLDGTITGATSPMEIFSEMGFYELIVTDANGCSNTSNKVLINFPAPSFQTSPFTACPGDIVKMGDWSFGPQIYPYYDWDLGDGTIDTGVYVEHAYADTGWYNIVRTVRTSNGSCNSFNDSIQISWTAIPPVDFDILVNSRNWLYNSACIGDKIEFFPYAYTYWFVPPPPFDATSYLWDFGDGVTDTTQFPVHYYTQYGMYAMSLTVTNHCGNSNTTMDSILIDSTLIPIADFDWIAGNGVYFDTLMACETVVFNSYGGLNYHWDFDDGAVSSISFDTISHSFATAGTYNVKLTITNGCGNVDSLTRPVTVIGTCTSIFNPSLEDVLTVVFPNPFRDNATIKITDFKGKFASSKFELIIFDPQGKIVESRRVEGQEIIINRSDLANGIYFFRLRNENGISFNGRFVLQ